MMQYSIWTEVKFSDELKSYDDKLITISVIDLSHSRLDVAVDFTYWFFKIIHIHILANILFYPLSIYPILWLFFYVQIMIHLVLCDFI